MQGVSFVQCCFPSYLTPHNKAHILVSAEYLASSFLPAKRRLSGPPQFKSPAPPDLTKSCTEGQSTFSCSCWFFVDTFHVSRLTQHVLLHCIQSGDLKGMNTKHYSGNSELKREKAASGEVCSPSAIPREMAT